MTLIQLDVFQTFPFKRIRQIGWTGFRFKRNWKMATLHFLSFLNLLVFEVVSNFNFKVSALSLCVKLLTGSLLMMGVTKSRRRCWKGNQRAWVIMYVVLRLDTYEQVCLRIERTHPRSIFFDKKPSSFVRLSHVTHCMRLSLSLLYALTVRVSQGRLGRYFLVSRP